MGAAIQRVMIRISCPHPSGAHSVACHSWGNEGGQVVLCVPGLTRNARDFDALAARLADHYRILCVDLPGRGESESLQDVSLYRDETYLADIAVVMDRFRCESVRWIGTSLGGRLGMKMAATRPERVAALVLNDIGAKIDGAELSRLRAGSAVEPSFADLNEAEAWMRIRYSAFGRLSDDRWRALTATSVKRTADGSLRPCFDPRAVPAAANVASVDYSDIYREIRCPVLVLRGAESQLLSRATCEAMAQSGPRARWVEVPGAGHAPDLGDDALIEIIFNFLKGVP